MGDCHCGWNGDGACPPHIEARSVLLIKPVMIGNKHRFASTRINFFRSTKSKERESDLQNSLSVKFVFDVNWDCLPVNGPLINSESPPSYM